MALTRIIDFRAQPSLLRRTITETRVLELVKTCWFQQRTNTSEKAVYFGELEKERMWRKDSTGVERMGVRGTVK